MLQINFNKSAIWGGSDPFEGKLLFSCKVLSFEAIIWNRRLFSVSYYIIYSRENSYMLSHYKYLISKSFVNNFLWLSKIILNIARRLPKVLGNQIWIKKFVNDIFFKSCDFMNIKDIIYWSGWLPMCTLFIWEDPKVADTLFIYLDIIK